MKRSRLGRLAVRGSSASRPFSVSRVRRRVSCVKSLGGHFGFRSSSLREERERATRWFLLLLKYAHYSNVTTAQFAACNRMHSVDARMSRWLLMTHDRVDSNDFLLTQEFLSQMLGIARPTVNIAGSMLQKAGFIRYARGRITVLDRAGLESASCECYRRIRREFDESVNGHRDFAAAKPTKRRK